MVKVLPNEQGCKFFGYAPATEPGRFRSKVARDAYTADAETLKAYSFKPIKYGFRAEVSASVEALKIEEATGVDMVVFAHDYL